MTKEQKAHKATIHKIWARKNKDKRNEYRRKLFEANPILKIKNMLMLRRRKKLQPWLSHYDCARTRCLNKKRSTYARYGGRGIEFRMVKDDFKKMWFRDKAYKMKMPSVDRIDNDGHYEFSNCRFIEHSKNCTKGNYESRWKR